MLRATPPGVRPQRQSGAEGGKWQGFFFLIGNDLSTKSNQSILRIKRTFWTHFCHSKAASSRPLRMNFEGINLLPCLKLPGEATRVSTSKTWILDNGRSGKALGVSFFLGSGLVMDMMGFWWILDGYWMGFWWDFDGFLLRLLLRVCRMATCFFYYLPWHLSNGIETINQSQPLLRVQFFFFWEATAGSVIGWKGLWVAGSRAPRVLYML